MAAPSKSKDDPNATSGCLEQPQHMDSSCPTQLKAIASLVHKANNAETSNLNNSALVSRSEGQSDPYQGEYINAGMDGTKKSNHVKKRRVSRKPNIPTASRLWFVDNNNSNKEKESQDEVMTKENGMIGHTGEAIATSSNGHKRTGTTKTNEVPNSSSLLVGKKHVQGFRDNLGDNSSHSRLQSNNASFMEGRNAIVSSKHSLPNEFTKTNLKLPNRNKLVEGNGKTNDSKCRRKQPLLEEMLDTHGGIGSDGAVQHNLTCRSMKRWRCIEDNEDEEDNGGDQCAMVVEHVKGVHLENLTSVPVMKQRKCTKTNEGKVDGGYQNPFGVENDCEGVRRRNRVNTLKQGNMKMRCVTNIDGIFKIDGKEYISLAGYFSTKSCEKVRKLSLPQVVQVTKVPRLAVWPKIWKASKPTAFQTKHYLWAAFKAKEDKGAVIVGQEEDKEKQHASSQLPEVQSEASDQQTILMKGDKPLVNQQLPANSIQEVETCCVQGPTNMRPEHEAPEERTLRIILSSCWHQCMYCCCY
ncbi:hypothetical protein C2845_PM05G04940 [Panicum miliaceum]|uniref:AIPP2-like SPOC-like domain-containing protein n=1 Tax=Panicum miliaceum TaxID=4540 RepID=A0A3L6T5B2_PANMI|nr:hypothetical protein C2845_PM05G04940 [Panicum miliaceum]